MSSLCIPLVVGCILQASYDNHVPPDLVASIIAVEGGRNGLSSKNRDDSEDLGLMQINTKVWLPHVSKKLFHDNHFIAYHQLRYNACFNIKIGTWILAQSILQAKGNIWQGIGYYHSHHRDYANSYISKVKNMHAYLFPDK